MNTTTGVVRSLAKHFVRRDTDYQKLPTDDLPDDAKESRVYVFGETDLADDEVNNEELALRDRSKGVSKGGRPKDDDLLVDREIADGDTLQSLSLKYGSPVSELKRVNNLIRDQDFYALKYLKVPMKRHGLLLEMVEKEQLTSEGFHSSEAAANGTDMSDYDMDTVDEAEVREISIRGPVGSRSNNPTNHLRFLDQMDKDINNIVTSTRTRLDSLEKVVEKITCKTIHPLKRRSSASFWSGADCGMRWWTIVLVMFLVGLVTPLLYLVYYEFMKPQE